MFKKILVAIDGSGHARRATEVAGDIAGKYQAELLLLHVIGHGRVPASLMRMLEAEHLTEAEQPGMPNVANVAGGIAVAERGGDSREHEEQMKEAIAQRALEEAERIARSKNAKVLSCLTERGDPVECILECAVREGVDLVVMGTRGLSDLKGLLMGSVSHKVCQLSACTCITVK